MNLSDAIRSGKGFRRPGWSAWCYVNPEHQVWTDPHVGSQKKLVLSANDVLAEDWEIVEPTVTITRTQFLEAARLTWEADFDRTREHPEQFSLKLADRLGLWGVP